MSDRKQANAKQKAEYLHDEMAAGKLQEKRWADTAADAERKPLLVAVFRTSARDLDHALHRHCLILNTTVVANDTRGKGGH